MTRFLHAWRPDATEQQWSARPAELHAQTAHLASASHIETMNLQPLAWSITCSATSSWGKMPAGRIPCLHASHIETTNLGPFAWSFTCSATSSWGRMPAGRRLCLHASMWSVTCRVPCTSVHCSYNVQCTDKDNFYSVTMHLYAPAICSSLQCSHVLHALLHVSMFHTSC
jgi:hypothetical protein